MVCVACGRWALKFHKKPKVRQIFCANYLVYRPKPKSICGSKFIFSLLQRVTESYEPSHEFQFQQGTT